MKINLQVLSNVSLLRANLQKRHSNTTHYSKKRSRINANSIDNKRPIVKLIYTLHFRPIWLLLSWEWQIQTNQGLKSSFPYPLLFESKPECANNVGWKREKSCPTTEKRNLATNTGNRKEKLNSDHVFLRNSIHHCMYVHSL